MSPNLRLINVRETGFRIHLQLALDKSAEDDNVNRNFLRYLVTGTNGCIANVISKPFPYLGLTKALLLILVEQ